MKLFRFVLASLLALCLVLMPVVSSANAGSTTVPTPTKTLPTGFKFPPISEIAKRLASRANVVNYAVESLLGAVDWVLDPANNQIRYKPQPVAQDVLTSSMNPNDYVYPVHHTEFKVDIMYTTPVQACVHHIWNTYHNAKHVYTGYEFSQSGLLSCQFKNVIEGYESSIGWFPTLDREKDKEYTLPLDVVAEQIVKNAKAGHVESVEFILTMEAEKANEDTDTSNPDKEKDDKPEPPKECMTISGRKVKVGTIGYRHDKVPPSKPHKPFLGDHYNLYKANRNPKNGQCFWQSIGAKDASKGQPPPLNSIPIEPFI